jgi:hypothetical protein
MNIPATVHLVFLSKNEKYPEVFVMCIERIKALHPEWEIRIYNGDDAIEIINQHLPYLLPLYKSYTHLVQRADLFRVILVYLFGGFYLDMDMYCLKPLDELRRFKLVLGEEKTLSAVVCDRLGLREQLRVANYMFGSIAGHPFWLFFLEAALKQSFKNIVTENDILETTGPGLLSDLFGRRKDIFKDIVLLENKDRNCLAETSHKASCYFGNYAAHLHQGTWRWDNGLQKHINKEITPIGEKEFSRANSILKRPIRTSLQNNYKISVCLSSDKNRAYNFLFNAVKTLNGTGNKQGKNIVLVCGDPTGLTEPLSPLNINVLYTSFNTSTKLMGAIARINKLFQVCMVATTQDKDAFISSGLNIPVHVVNPGFKRYARNFSTDENSAYFNVGFQFDNPALKYYDLLVKACEELQNQNIPIRLKIYSDNLIVEEQAPPFVAVETRYFTDADFASWYNNIHCSIHLAIDNSFAFAPCESLYLGIPTIINHAACLPELTGLGFFDVIDLDKNDAGGTLKNALLNVYTNYPHKQEIAAKGAKWIEDKWLIQDAQQQIVSILDDLHLQPREGHKH